LPEISDHFKEILLCKRETLFLREVHVVLSLKELNEKFKVKMYDVGSLVAK